MNTDEDGAAIKELLVQKHEWNPDEIQLTVSANDGMYAKGMVNQAGEERGGGLWFAAKANGTWKLVFDGNGIVTCEDLAPYPDFPAELIPQCYDSTSGKMVER